MTTSEAAEKTLLSLNCLVEGDDPYENVFGVEIGMTETVYELKKLIKNKNGNTFNSQIFYQPGNLHIKIRGTFTN